MIDIKELFPETFDVEFYRLKNFNDAFLINHYKVHGKDEGCSASPGAFKEYIKDLIYDITPALEIGPFSKPFLNPKTTNFFDILSQEELKERARHLGNTWNPDTVPFIDYISPIGDLSIVHEKFDLVYSSHCIEHQPNFVKHLHQAECLLNDKGVYVLFIPDYRFCFDHYRPPSHIGEILEAYFGDHTFHTLQNMIEQYTRSTHNTPSRHWKGDHGNMEKIQPKQLLQIIKKWQSAKKDKKYIDLHAWKLTPDIFAEIISLLQNMDLIKLSLFRVYDTPRDRTEFCAILTKSV